MTGIWHPSPNFDSRDGCSISMLVLHYTGMRTPQEAINRLIDPASKVSAHYIVDEDGTVLNLVKEEHRAWHAGVSGWRGETRVNHHSIGIEIVNPGHEFGYRPFPDMQMESVISLCKEILGRHAIEPRNVIGHSDVAPTRKEDPGELFDWEELAKNGVGLMPQPHLPFYPPYMPSAGFTYGYSRTLVDDFFLEQGMKSDAVLLMRNQLSNYGYMIDANDDFDEMAMLSVVAFQRHFRRHKVNGVWDMECHLAIEELLNKVIVP